MRLQPAHIEEIKSRFSTTETVDELAQLLNWIYEIKFPSKGKDTNVRIEPKHLTYYAFKATDKYKRFSIKKKSGGERSISAPRYKLKTIQKCLNEIFNAVFTPHFAATGFVPKKSIVDNAKVHVGKQFVFNTDLKDFFPSTEFRRIKTVLGLAPFYLTDQNEINSNKEKKKVSDEKGKGHLAYLIANLCCENGFLPQGAPTSPTLTNLVCQSLDKKLYKFAKKINATYSRYADDITFSANKSIFNDDFKKTLTQIIEVQENFKINFEKERLQNGGERQSVTGIVVNRKSNVDRKFIKDVRFWLMCWQKFNAGETQKKFLIQFPDKKGFLRYNGVAPQFYNYLYGKILFLGMVRGSKDEMYLKFKTKYENLFSNMSGKELTVATTDAVLQKHELNIYSLLEVWKTEGIENAIKKYPL
ncbi:MAG: reverse transcriptase domain-containing protein [Bacteroidota bacterium]